MEKTAKPIRRLKNLLTGGNLWLYILSLIKKEGELYAYSLDSAIEKGFMFRPNKIMVYVVLYKLEGEGLISSEFRERRKYYKLTKNGEEALISAREYIRMIAEKI